MVRQCVKCDVKIYKNRGVSMCQNATMQNDLTLLHHIWEVITLA
jgi:hypothetical protein